MSYQMKNSIDKYAAKIVDNDYKNSKNKKLQKMMSQQTINKMIS